MLVLLPSLSNDLLVFIYLFMPLLSKLKFTHFTAAHMTILSILFAAIFIAIPGPKSQEFRSRTRKIFLCIFYLPS